MESEVCPRGAPAGSGQFAVPGSGLALAPARGEEKEPDGRVQALAAATVPGPPAPPRECACLPLAALRQCGGGRAEAAAQRPRRGHARALARLPQPAPRSPAPVARSPQPRARRRLFNGQPARRSQLPRAHHRGGLRLHLADGLRARARGAGAGRRRRGPGAGARAARAAPGAGQRTAPCRSRAGRGRRGGGRRAGTRPRGGLGLGRGALAPRAGRKDVAGERRKRRAIPARWAGARAAARPPLPDPSVPAAPGCPTDGGLRWPGAPRLPAVSLGPDRRHHKEVPPGRT